MSYPDEIVERCATTYNLSSSTKNLLRDTLNVKGMQPIIENHYLEAEDLLKKTLTNIRNPFNPNHGKYCSALSVSYAQQIVSAYNAIKDSDAFITGRIKLTDMMVRHEAGSFKDSLSVLSESFAQQVAKNPERLEEIREKVINPLGYIHQSDDSESEDEFDLNFDNERNNDLDNLPLELQQLKAHLELLNFYISLFHNSAIELIANLVNLPKQPASIAKNSSTLFGVPKPSTDDMPKDVSDIEMANSVFGQASNTARNLR